MSSPKELVPYYTQTRVRVNGFDLLMTLSTLIKIENDIVQTTPFYLTMQVFKVPCAMQSLNYRNLSYKFCYDFPNNKYFTIASRSNPGIIDPYTLYITGSYEDLSIKPYTADVSEWYAPEISGMSVDDKTSAKGEDKGLVNRAETKIDSAFKKYISHLSAALAFYSEERIVKGGRWSLSEASVDAANHKTPLAPQVSKLAETHLQLRRNLEENTTPVQFDLSTMYGMASVNPLLLISMGSSLKAFLKEYCENMEVENVAVHSHPIPKHFGTMQLSSLTAEEFKKCSIGWAKKRIAKDTKTPNLLVVDLTNSKSIKTLDSEQYITLIENWQQIAIKFQELTSDPETKYLGNQMPKIVFICDEQSLAPVPMKADEREYLRYSAARTFTFIAKAEGKLTQLLMLSPLSYLGESI